MSLYISYATFPFSSTFFYVVKNMSLFTNFVLDRYVGLWYFDIKSMSLFNILMKGKNYVQKE